MPKRKYTDEHIRYLKEHASGTFLVDLLDQFNNVFALSITPVALKSLMRREGIKNGLKHQRKTPVPTLLTDEQETFLRQHVKGRLNEDLTALMNETFGLSLTPRQLAIWKKNHNVTSGVNTAFEKGHVPINAGTKGMFNVGGNKTSFKKGDQPKNYKPVGSERIDRDGYVLVKVKDEGTWDERWRHKHKVLWETEHGSIPEGHVLNFLDGDRTNLSLGNLILLSRAEHLAMTRQNLRFRDPEMTKVGSSIAKLEVKRRELVKDERLD